MLRKDKALQALHTAYFKNMPRQQDIFKSSPEEAAIAGENWDKWFENIMDDIGRFERQPADCCPYNLLHFLFFIVCLYAFCVPVFQQL